MLYPSHIVWEMNIQDRKDLNQVVGKRTAQDIKSSLEHLKKSEYSFQIEAVNNSYLDEFIPLYEKDILSKQGKIKNVREAVNRDIGAGDTAEALSLRRGEKFLGGVIYFYNATSKALDLAYQTLPHELEIPLAAGWSHLAEYYVFLRAIELGKIKISKGRDENPFGPPPSPAIGLASYKLRMGYFPRSNAANGFHDTKNYEVNQDTLFFLADEPDQSVSKAVLVVLNSQAAKEQYKSLFTQEKIEIILKKC